MGQTMSNLSEKTLTRIKCELIRRGEGYAVEIPMMLIYTQGESKEDAYSMAKDAVENVFNRADVEVSVSDVEDDIFYITAINEKTFVDFIRKQSPTTVEVMNRRRN